MYHKSGTMGYHGATRIRTTGPEASRIPIRYIDAQDIIDDVKNTLSHYFSAGKLDMSIYPRVLRSMVQRMSRRKGKISPIKSTVIELCNYQADLPEDFDRMVMAMMCNAGKVYAKNPTKWSVDQKIVTELNLCEGKYSVCTDSCGRMTKLIENREYDPFSYEEFIVMSPSMTSNMSWCDKDCFKFNGGRNDRWSYQVTEHRGKRIFSSTEESGKVYIEYRSNLEQEDGFMVPDVPQIRDWIYSALLVESFRYLWYRGEEVQGRLQLAERELYVKKEEADIIIATPEVYELYDMAHTLSNRYKAMEDWVGVDRVYRPRG